MSKRPVAPELFADLAPGAIVRCHSGTVIVTGRMAGGYLARLYDEQLHREASEPIWFGPTTGVLEVLGGQARGERHGAGPEVEVDPLLARQSRQALSIGPEARQDAPGKRFADSGGPARVGLEKRNTGQQGANGEGGSFLTHPAGGEP